MKKTFFALALTSLLAACASSSHVNHEGKSDDVVWPKISESDLTKRGSFPQKEAVNLIQKNMTRDQIYHLVGVPHFSEGFQVREWDYLLHFNTVNGVESCQMKLLFDKNKTVQTILWKEVGTDEDSCSAVNAVVEQ